MGPLAKAAHQNSSGCLEKFLRKCGKNIWVDRAKTLLNKGMIKLSRSKNKENISDMFP